MIDLIAIDGAVADALAAGPGAFASRYGVEPGENAELVAGVVEQTLAMPRHEEPWCGYLAADSGIGRVIGTCAFVGAPTGDGAVEIAYFTFPQFERRGYASAMASALLRMAAAQDQVARVIAHTLPEQNASTRVLSKHGFQQRGEAVDDEAGTVWRWELDLAAPASADGRRLSAAELEAWLLVERGWNSLAAADADGFAATLHPEFLGWSTGRETPCDRATEHTETAAFLARYDWVSYDLRLVDLRITGDTAVVHYQYREVVREKDGAGVHDETGRACQVLKSDASGWQTLAIMSGPVQ